MTFLTRSLRYSLMATTALTLNTLIPAWADQTNACRDIIVHPEAHRHQQALEQSFYLFKHNGNGLPLLHTPSETYTYSKEAYRIDWQLEDARAAEKLHEWEGGGGGAIYNSDRTGGWNAILSMHIANTEQGMSRQDSAQKLFTYFLNLHRVTDECHNKIPNGLVEVWNDLDEASRKRHIRSIMFADNRKDKLLLDLLIQSGGHGITITDRELTLHSREDTRINAFMRLVTNIRFNGHQGLLNDATLARLTRTYPYIASLGKIRNFDRSEAQAIANIPTLRQLNLFFISRELGVINALRENRTLWILYLVGTYINDTEAIDLAGNTTLLELHLTHNRIGDAGAIALAGNTTLRKLCLGENRIGDAGAVALAGNTALRELNLGWNQIGDEGAIALARNTALRKLDLSHNQIGAAGAIALAGNTNLLALNLYQNAISDAGAQEFLRLLIQNKSPLKKLDIRWNDAISQPIKQAFKAWATANGVELLID